MESHVFLRCSEMSGIRWLSNVFGRLEQWVGLDLRYYGKNSLYLVLAHTAVLASSLALSMSFARLTSEETYGQYSYIMGIIGLLTIFSLPGMTTAITRSVARGYDQTFVQGTKTRLKWSLIGSLIILGVGIYYYHFAGSTVLGKSFITATFVFPFFSTARTFRSFLQGRSQFAQASAYESVARLSSVVASIVVMWLLRDVFLIVIAYLSSFSLINYLFFFRVSRGEGLNRESDEKALPYAKHLTAQGAIDTASQYYDTIIIPVFLNFPDLAIYSIAKCVNSVTPFMATPLATIFPKLAQIGEKEAYRAVKKRLVYMVLFYAFICGAGIAFAPYVIPLLYTHKYAGSVFLAQVLFVAIFLEQPGYVLSQLFKAQQKTRELYRLRLFVSVFEMILLTVLVASLGLVGVVIARVIGKASFSAAAWWRSR